MRIALAGIYQESHSFSPALAGINQFRAGYLLYDEQIIHELEALNHEVGGALKASADHEIVPLAYASAGASGQPIRKEAYDQISGDILSRLKAALPVDGVFLAMHGAMLAEQHDDATGHLLQAVRETVGPNIPIVSTLDLHANVTRKMVQAANALVGYHTAPHIDQGDTGRRGMELLLNILTQNVQPQMALRQIPMVVPSENGQTTVGPYSEVMAQVKTLEKEPGILAASVYSVQPWLDVPEMGCSAIVVTDGNPERARAEADRLALEMWHRRKNFTPNLLPLEKALDLALSGGRHPFVFSDSADAPSSGAPGDSTVLLKALLDRQVQETALLNIVDSEAVQHAIRAGVGNPLELTVGASMSSEFYGPVTFQAYVKSITDGTFRNKGPGFHGVEFRMGKTAVLVSGGVHLVVMEQPVIQWDPELYRSQGLDPAQATIVAAKSPAAFRAAYDNLAAEIHVLDVPGVCSPNLRSFPWKRITRPMFPFDNMADEL
ncbi:MAG: M81 family metallopeptidase [bacterium]|nr:M81 family metallopeptidase [bacterium]